MTEFILHNIDYCEWRLPSRYHQLKSIGSGTFGTICLGRDEDTGRDVAIKLLVRPFCRMQYAKRTFRELQLFCHLKHKNIISLFDIFTPQTERETFEDIYLVMEKMNTDLGIFAEQRRLESRDIQVIIYQVLSALKYIHKAGIIHADLKPSNIAINEDLSLKLLDFGTLRGITDGKTAYMVTRWYMAPEIKLLWVQFNEQVDIWSLGCIMAELFMGQKSFAGTDHFSEVERILLLTGSPDDEFISKMNEDCKKMVHESMVKSKRKDFNIFFGEYTEDVDAIDLLHRILVLDPDRRITVAEALRHRYMASHFNEEDLDDVVEEFRDSNEDNDTIEGVKDKVWHFIKSFQR